MNATDISITNGPPHPFFRISLVRATQQNIFPAPINHSNRREKDSWDHNFDGEKWDYGGMAAAAASSPPLTPSHRRSLSEFLASSTNDEGPSGRQKTTGRRRRRQRQRIHKERLYNMTLGIPPLPPKVSSQPKK